MNFKKYKWLFYIFTFFLITIVATILKEIQGKSIPQIIDAILLVGIVYGFIYLLYKLFKTIFRTRKNKNEQTTHEDKPIQKPDSNNKAEKGRGLNKAIIFTFVSLLALGGFYWFYWRPGEIRKSCANEAYRRAKKDQNITLGNNLYRYCLTQNGLKPESIFVSPD